MAQPEKSAEVRRILERYVVEIVEAYDLCPWARSARERGELGVDVLFGEPDDAAWIAAARRTLAGGSAKLTAADRSSFGADPVRVAMIVAPETVLDLAGFRVLRDRIAAALPDLGIAELHPVAALDLATPARLVPFLRRSPDPLLQLVPLSLLDQVRASPLPDRARQAQILAGAGEPARDVAAQIATANHATVRAAHVEIERVLDAIARDRAVAYARVGITSASR